jgi:hypothetical protein
LIATSNSIIKKIFQRTEVLASVITVARLVVSMTASPVLVLG